jgi:hypothetical protein
MNLQDPTSFCESSAIYDRCVGYSPFDTACGITHQVATRFDWECNEAGFGRWSSVNSNNVASCPMYSTTSIPTAQAQDSCLGDIGYWSCQVGGCVEAGKDHFSAAYSNERERCPSHSMTLGRTNTTARSIADCKGEAG